MDLENIFNFKTSTLKPINDYNCWHRTKWVLTEDNEVYHLICKHSDGIWSAFKADITMSNDKDLCIKYFTRKNNEIERYYIRGWEVKGIPLFTIETNVKLLTTINPFV